MARILLEDVGKTFRDGTEAVKNLDLEIADGELVVLVGPSGCGKTTALRMIAGLEEISNGTVLIGETRVNDLDPRKRDVAMVFQNYALYPHMTVGENIGFPLRISGVGKKERESRVKKIAQTLALEGHLTRKPRNLSGGQRQRVAMGRAIIREPQAFLMDEPLSNLDAKLRVHMRAEISAIQKALSVTTVYVTHDQVEAMTMGDRVAVLRRGELQQFGTPEEVYNTPANLFVAAFIGSPSMNLVESELASSGGSYFVALGSRSVRLDESELERIPELEAFVGKRLVVGIRPERLEDVELAPGGPADRRLGGLVHVREVLGSDVLVHFVVEGALSALDERMHALAHDVEDPTEVEELAQAVPVTDGVLFVGRCGPTSKAQEGERIEVVVKPGALQFFDAETGAALT